MDSRINYNILAIVETAELNVVRLHYLKDVYAVAVHSKTFGHLGFGFAAYAHGLLTGLWNLWLKEHALPYSLDTQ